MHYDQMIVFENVSVPSTQYNLVYIWNHATKTLTSSNLIRRACQILMSFND